MLHPQSASRCRHRLDVANACVTLRHYGQAVATLQDLRRTAPERLVHQRYARDILTAIIERRRTLSPEMRERADSMRLLYRGALGGHMPGLTLLTRVNRPRYQLLYPALRGFFWPEYGQRSYRAPSQFLRGAGAAFAGL